MICIAAAAAVGSLLGPLNVHSPGARGEALGRGLGQLSLFAVGIFLIVTHFTRGKQPTDGES